MRKRFIQNIIRFTEDENNKLNELVKLTNMTKVDLINLLIRKELERLGGNK